MFLTILSFSSPQIVARHHYPLPKQTQQTPKPTIKPIETYPPTHRKKSQPRDLNPTTQRQPKRHPNPTQTPETGTKNPK